MLYRALTIVLLLLSATAWSQCPQFYDQDGNLSSNPVWKFCDDAASTLNIQSDQNIGAYTIDWGDGNTENGPGLAAGDVVSHNYAAGIATYSVTITVGGCTITGTYIKELPVKASIEVPPNGVTQVCAPGIMEFINNSTGNSTNTVYTWNFGDGETLGPLDHTNAGQTVTHTYQAGTVQCDTRVTLTAQNECSTRPSEATFEPVQIWDVDKPGLLANPTLLCWPDNEVTYRNVTDRNCVLPEEGNTFQRYERWIFHDFFGPGQDSIIDWRPWPPSPDRTIAYPGPGTYTVTLQVRNYCGDASITRDITIIDQPEALFSLDKDTICVGETVTMTKLTGAPANRFRYTTGANNWTGFGGGNNRQFSYNSPGEYQVGFAIDIANSSPACKDTTYLPIVVLPDPTADFSISDSVACEQLTVDITNEAIDAVTLNWDFGNGTTYTGANPPDANYNSKGFYTITLDVVNGKGCTDSYQKEVAIYTSPQPDFNDGTACVGQTYEFEATGTEDADDPVTQWDWDFGDGNQGSGQSENHVYFQEGLRRVVLNVSSEHCQGQISRNIQIRALPVANFQPQPSVGCAPFDVTFVNNTLGGTKYYWDFDDGTVDSVNVHPSKNFGNNSGATIFREVQLVALNQFGCSDTFMRELEVKPEIEADFDALIDDNCTSVDVQFRNLTQNASSFFWDFGDTTTSTQEHPNKTYVNNSQFQNTVSVTLTVENAAGCTSTIVKEINIKPAADFGFEGVPDSTCTPADVIFQAQSGAVSYEWEFGDGTTANGQFTRKVFTNPTQQVRNYTVTLRAVTSEGCVDVSEQTITVFPKPLAAFDLSESAGCSPLSVQLTNSSVGAENYLWNYGEGSTSANAEDHFHVFENTSGSNRVFDVRLEVISEYGCRDTTFRQVTVYPGINANMTGDLTGCTPFLSQFSASGGDSYEWDFGDGGQAVGQNVSHNFVHNGTAGPTEYVVTLRAISNAACDAVIRDTVEVYPNPVAGFTMSENTGCTPLQVNFTPTATGASDYFWRFEGGQGTQNQGASVAYTYINQGASDKTEQPRLIVANTYGCRDTVERSVTIYPPVIAEAVYQDTGCSPLPVKFFNVSRGADSYFWDFGVFGSSSNASPTVTFTQAQNSYQSFPFSMIARSNEGCRDTVQGQVTLYPNPEANFGMNTTAGCEPLTVQFSNASLGATQYEWDYDQGERDNESAASFSRSFENEGQDVDLRDIRLMVSNSFGCRDTLDKQIQVFPRVEALFDSIPDDCSPHGVTVRNESRGATNITWSFSEGTQAGSQQAFVEFNNSSSSNRQEWVRLVARNAQGCTDTLLRYFNVLANPVADFTLTPRSQKYPNATVAVNNQTVGTWNYLWDFGDGSAKKAARDTSHTYDTWGDYLVKLVASAASCADSTTRLLSIDPPAPTANFSGGGQGCRPLTVQFQDQSQYAVSHAWDFGDGGSSPSTNPSYTYYQAGTFDVSLRVIGPDGSQSTYTIPSAVTVHENASAYFTYTPTTAFAREDPVDFLNLSTEATRFEWDFGDGQSSTERDPTHYYEAAGIYDVTLIADNQFGCADTFNILQALNITDGGFIELPNAFTPNPNGANGGKYDPEGLDNDVFFAFNKDVEEFRMEIFTRWGEKIFESDDIEIGWDGYSNGVLCQQEVYVYKVFARFSDGRTVEKIGDVTLLR